MDRKKILLLSVTGLCLSLSSCGGLTLPSSSNSQGEAATSSATKEDEILKIYRLYAENGGTLTYEEWLASIKGEPGKDGTSLKYGNGAPSTEIGQDGDSYIDVDNWDYYIKTAGSWTKLGNLKGVQGEQGPQGEKGDKGDDGVSIVSIEKTGSEGLLDTYTITYSDGSTSTFVVTNGEKGDQGIQGIPGENGHTPVVTVGENGNWFVDGEDTGVHAQGIQGPKGDKGDAGKSAYEIYKEAHPDYEGDEQQWLDDLVNGKLGTEEKKAYTVTFDLGYDNLTFTQEVEEGKKATKPETPKRNGYNFVDWVDENDDHWVFNGFSITDDITLYAVWSDPIEYTVTFVNNGGTVLDIETGNYGDTVVYHGVTPVAENQDPHYIYTFTGWDKDLTITGDMTATAQYTSSYVATTAYYYDYDGETLLDEVPLAEGDIPVYHGDLPTRENDEASQLMFEFAGWEKTQETGETIVFKATYRACSLQMDIQNGMIVVYRGSSESVVIPDEWNGVPITKIDSAAFKNTRIVSVNIPSTVKSIGDNAFRDCKKLTTINLPEGLESLSEGMFAGCSNLQEIRIPDSVAYSGWSETFAGCSSLRSIILPEGFTGICRYMFSGCTSLEEVYLPSSLRSIGMGAFMNCTSLKTIFIPESVRNIEVWAFGDCSQLTIYLESEYIGKDWNDGWNSSYRPVVFGQTRESVSTIFSEANHCYYSISNQGGIQTATYLRPEAGTIDINIPSVIDGYPVSQIYLNTMEGVRNSAKSITTPDDIPIAALDCREMHLLEQVVFGDNSISAIPNSAFYECFCLKNIKLPSSLTFIDSGAFYSCAFEIIYLPESITNIEQGAFFGCRKLRHVLYGSSTIPYFYNIFESDHDSSANVSEEEGVFFDYEDEQFAYHLFPHTGEAWISSYHGESSEVVVPDTLSVDGKEYTIVRIVAFAFQETKIQSLDMSQASSLTEIGQYALCGCLELSNIVLPPNINAIRTWMFESCWNIKSIILPKSITRIEYRSFNGTRLKQVFSERTSEDDGNPIQIDSLNDSLTSAEWYYYSEEEPAEAGNYWHYVDGVPTIW